MSIVLDLVRSEYPAGLRQPAHRHDELHLSFLLRGSLRETVGGHSVAAGLLTVLSKDPGVTHANEFGPESVAIARLSVPSRGIADIVEDPDRGAPWRLRHDAFLARPFLALLRRTGADQAVRSDDTDMCDLLAALTARQAPAARGAPPTWLRKAIDELRASWTPGTSVGDVAGRTGVHPVYLARCVRRWFGHSVGDELRRLRLAAAVDALSRGGETVSSIAHRVGYTDESHLCRDFKRMLNATPGSVRQSTREVSRVQGKPVVSR